MSNSADLGETSVALIAPAGRALAAPPWFTATLLVADEGERSAEALVVGNRTLVDLAGLVEGTVSELDRLVTDRKRAIEIIDNGYALCRSPPWLARSAPG
jgi:hypothetical protein